MRWLRATLRLSVVLLVASIALVVPGTLGVGAGVPLLLVLAGLALGGYLGRGALAGVRPRLGVHLGRYLAVTWLGPAVAFLVVLLALDATPAEVQALGGLVGLLAMLNYFLRPVYVGVVAAGRWLANV